MKTSFNLLQHLNKLYTDARRGKSPLRVNGGV